MKIKRYQVIADLGLPLAAAMTSVVLNGGGALAEPLPGSIAQSSLSTSERPSSSEIASTVILFSDEPSGEEPSTIQQTQPQIISQFERIYISAEGDFLGAHTIVENTALYIDRAGHVSLSARDYTAELDYDYRGRLQRIGTATIEYDFRGRIQQVGTTQVDYDFRSRVAHIGQVEIAYTSRGKVAQIGDVEIRYDRNVIDTISANFTSSGARVVVVDGRHT